MACHVIYFFPSKIFNKKLVAKISILISFATVAKSLFQLVIGTLRDYVAMQVMSVCVPEMKPIFLILEFCGGDYSDMGYRVYAIEGASALLYRPFVSVYFGAAYLKWLSTYDGK